MSFNIDRKAAYASMIVGYYTFILSFGLQSGFTDLIAGSIMIGAFSYGWFLFSASRKGIMVSDLTDLLVNIAIFTFTSSFIIFFAFWLSVYWDQAFTFLKTVLSLVSVMLWDGIWIDFYFQRIEGNM